MLLTCSTNLGTDPSFSIVISPLFCDTVKPFALKLMQNTTVGVFAVILANPPIPANAPGPLCALIFPY